jgi:predicted alpha/beta superfamily hydrolase
MEVVVNRAVRYLVLLQIFGWVQVAGAAEDPALNVGFSRAIRSQVLEEDRTLQIYLPPSYQSSHGYQRYPVLYFRDGGKFFHSFTGTLAQLTSDATPRAPEMILVGIVETDRVRDSSSTRSLRGFTGKAERGYASSGGGARFLRFLEEELVPYIDASFSTSGYRIYCGYSFTGLSVLASLLDEKASFDAYIAIDPSWWWDDYATDRAARAGLATRKFSGVQLFLASSGETYPTRYFPAVRDVQSLAALLKQKAPAGLDWSARRYTDESHHSMAQRTLYDALSHVFRGYKPTLEELYNRPELLLHRYERLSARLGEKVMLSEGLLSFFGYQFLHDFKEPEKAAQYFQMSAGYYAQSPNVWNSLGETYAVSGDAAAAIRMYEEALSLDPGNENAKKGLEELRAK